METLDITYIYELANFPHSFKYCEISLPRYIESGLEFLQKWNYTPNMEFIWLNTQIAQINTPRLSKVLVALQI